MISFKLVNNVGKLVYEVVLYCIIILLCLKHSERHDFIGNTALLSVNLF